MTEPRCCHVGAVLSLCTAGQAPDPLLGLIDLSLPSCAELMYQAFHSFWSVNDRQGATRWRLTWKIAAQKRARRPRPPRRATSGSSTVGGAQTRAGRMQCLRIPDGLVVVHESASASLPAAAGSGHWIVWPTLGAKLHDATTCSKKAEKKRHAAASNVLRVVLEGRRQRPSQIPAYTMLPSLTAHSTSTLTLSRSLARRASSREKYTV
jgi:hypothetical protein